MMHAMCSVQHTLECVSKAIIAARMLVEYANLACFCNCDDSISSKRLFRPLLPPPTMSPLFPFPDHLWHAFHSLPPLVQTVSHCSFPVFTLDLLSNTSALHSQPLLNSFLFAHLRVLGTERHQR